MRLSRPFCAAAMLALTAGCGRDAPIQVGPGDDLAARLAQAPDRGTVRIAAGRYLLREAGILGKSLNITGAGIDSTFIETTGDDRLVFSDSLYSALQDLTVTAITVERGQLTLVGVRVSGAGVPVYGRNGSRLILRNSEITGEHAVGLRLEGGAAATLEGALLDGGSSYGDAGVEIQPGARASVLNTVIRRYSSALRIAAEADAEIHGNLIEEVGAAGFEGGASRWRIDDNVAWLTGVAPAEPTIRRVCGNLPALKYGKRSAFYGTFCRDRPGRE